MIPLLYTGVFSVLENKGINLWLKKRSMFICVFMFININLCEMLTPDLWMQL